MRITIILLLGFMGLGLGTCQKDERAQLLAKKWQVVFNAREYLEFMPEEKRAIYDSLPEKRKQEALLQVQKQANQNLFEFKADQTFEFSVKGKEIKQAGKWRLEDSNKLILTREGEKGYDELIIKNLKSDTLIIISKQENDTYLETLMIPS